MVDDCSNSIDVTALWRHKIHQAQEEENQDGNAGCLRSGSSAEAEESCISAASSSASTYTDNYETRSSYSSDRSTVSTSTIWSLSRFNIGNQLTNSCRTIRWLISLTQIYSQYLAFEKGLMLSGLGGLPGGFSTHGKRK